MKYDVNDVPLYMPPSDRDAYDEVDKMGKKKYKFERQTGRRTSNRLSLLVAKERQCGCPKFYDKEFDDRSYRQSYAVLRNRVCHVQHWKMFKNKFLYERFTFTGFLSHNFTENCFRLAKRYEINGIALE